jgi:hypothetical protein
MTRTRTITIHEIKSLADKLLSDDGLGTLAAVAPDHSCDVWLAANCLRAMARSFNGSDAVTINGE